MICRLSARVLKKLFEDTIISSELDKLVGLIQPNCTKPNGGEFIYTEGVCELFQNVREIMPIRWFP